MPGKVALMNRALRVFAGPIIVAPDDGTAAAAACSQAWDDALDAVLADYPWSHAQRWERLGMVEEKPPFGFSFAYRLPADALRLVDVRSSEDLTLPPVRHVISGQLIFSNAHPVFARYVFRNADCTFWPQHFCEAFCMRLAAEVAPHIASDSQIGLRLRSAYYEVLERSWQSDALQSNLPEENPEHECDFLKGRNF